MIHKTTDPFYYKDFKKLADNIGDLRYDVLAEFLCLLSDKIKKDGEKDLKNGRVKLAHSLDLASKSLENAAKNIDESWTISMPFILPLDIIHKIKSEFKSKEEQEEVIKLISQDWLLEYQSDCRIARCLLYETNGDIQKLRENYEMCRQDPRDIMLQAEYDDNSNWLRFFGKPFGQEYIFEEAKYETEKEDIPKPIEKETFTSLSDFPFLEEENQNNHKDLPF
jgi:hypothetical protein